MRRRLFISPETIRGSVVGRRHAAGTLNRIKRSAAKCLERALDAAVCLRTFTALGTRLYDVGAPWTSPSATSPAVKAEGDEATHCDEAQICLNTFVSLAHAAFSLLLFALINCVGWRRREEPEGGG